jgi:endoglucanase Acf2
MSRYSARLRSVSLGLVVVGCASTLAPNAPRDLRPAAGGHYSTKPPAGEVGPADADGRAAVPKLVPGSGLVPQTNDWWSSLIWSYQTGAKQNPHSERMFPHPLAMHAEAGGLWVGYPSEPKVEARGYFHPFVREVLVGIDGLRAERTLVAGYGDWTVTARWSDAEHALDLTAGHGLPFVYATSVRGKARVAVPGGSIALRGAPGTSAFATKNGHGYGLFLPPGAAWSVAGDVATADLAGKDYFSVALLPDASDETFSTFEKHAYAFVTGSRVSYRYDRPRAHVVTAFEVDVEAKPAPIAKAESAPLQALYRHQWKSTRAELSKLGYASPRGEMKLLAGARFETELPVGGILPALPDRGGYDRGELRSLLDLAANTELFAPGLEGTRDSYWEGKSLGKVAGLVRIADQLGERSTRDDLLGALKRELEDWFDGQPPRYFYENSTWKTLIGVPTMYHSGAQLNDHHFHYGYYVLAAATIAQYDAEWAKRWAPFVELLIKDAANYERADTRFPYLRYFDPYAGHSWASGTTFFERGNNEESSSEDVNFAAAVALYGEVTQNPKLRDTGLFLYANVTSAVAEYWYDVDRAVYPPGFRHPAVGIVWGSGAAYDTWFNPLPEFIHGIQLTPMFPGSLWLGKHPKAVERVLAHVRKQHGGEPVIWRDLYLMLEAFVAPERASARFDGEHYFEPEFGNSLVYTHHFIENLRALGRVDASVTADTPLFAVFERAGRKSYVAYNATSAPLSVRFSDGTVLDLAARELGSKVPETAKGSGR